MAGLLLSGGPPAASASTARPASAAKAAGVASAVTTVTAVRGSACGYYTNVGLFGGPQTLKGCGQDSSQPSSGASPTASLAPDGSNSPQNPPTSNGAAADYGPARIFGGRWPIDLASAPPSGPISVSTQGTVVGVNAGGTVTSTADIQLNPSPGVSEPCASGYSPPCYAPGGFGPWPVEGDSLHVTCSASKTAVTGSTTFSNAQLAIATDANGNPTTIEHVPSGTAGDPLPVNYTRHGVITNVGDVFTVVYNQQIVNSDGSLTVNAVHMYLFGPTAVGEVVKGSVTCGTTSSVLTPSDTDGPVCGKADVEPNSPTDPTPKSPRTELVGVFDPGTVSGLNRNIADGSTTAGSTSLTSATAAFDSTKDVGAVIVGDGLPGPPAFIQSVTNSTTAVISASAAAATTGDRWTILRPGGLQSISQIQATNATVQVAQPPQSPPNPSHYYLEFFAGQTGPLQVVATQVDTSKPMSWSFVATDVAGNSSLCHGATEATPADFVGNGTTDISVYRPSAGEWLIQNQSNVFLGNSSDIPVPCNYNGGAAAVPAVFRPSVGGWYIQGQAPVFFGLNGDIPVPGDYNGDGTCDIAVFRPSVGGWYIMNQPTVFFGLSGDIPLPGNYSGGSTMVPAVFRPSVGGWYINGQSTVFFGLNGDVPVPGDYFGDGKTHVGVFRPQVGGWYIQGKSTVFLGLQGDIPQPGDYNGDGVTDVAVYRPGTGAWYVNGQPPVFFGISGDIPLVLPSSIRTAFS